MKKAEQQCEAVTPVMRAIDNVPAGARWRISWMIHAFTPPRREWAYVLSDAIARRWCARHGVAFPGPSEPQPGVGAGEPDIALPQTAVFTRHIAEPAPFDVRSRAAGEES